MKARPRLLVSVIAAGTLIAGASWLVLRGDPPKVLQTSEGAVLVAGTTSSGMEMGIEARLAFTDQGCLGLADPASDGPAYTPAVFPSGTEVVSDNPLVIRFNGTDVTLGDTFKAGGGEVRADSDDIIPSTPKRCVSGTVTLLGPA